MQVEITDDMHTLIQTIGYLGVGILFLAGMGLIGEIWDRITAGWWGPY